MIYFIYTNRLINALIVSLVLFLFSFIFFAQAESFCEEGEIRCNTYAQGIIQVCGNCDGDPELEWCNSERCDENTVCSEGICQGVECDPGQIIGDANNDKWINKADLEILNNISSGVLNAPEEICCFDLNKDEEVNEEDVSFVEDIINRKVNFPGKCEEEVIEEDSVEDNTGGNKAGEQVIQGDIEKDDSNDIKNILIIAAIFIVIIITVFIIYNRSNKKKE